MTGPASGIPEAIAAAAEAIERELMTGATYYDHATSDEVLARAAVEAAAPLIAAAERERIARLAERHGVHYGCYVAVDGTQTSGLRAFADLIREDGDD